MYMCEGRVSIRDFSREDIENKVKWINDPRNNRYLHYNIPLNIEDTMLWFDKRDTQKRQDCVIEYDGVPVGLVGLLNIDNISQKAEFYISLGEHEQKKKGIGTQATQLVLKYAFECLHLNKVYLTVDKDNVPARNLYEKVGFKCEGVFIQDLLHRGHLVDRVRYAILKNEYKVKTSK